MNDGFPEGDRKALNELFSITYEELRRLAASVRRGDPSATLNPTALVNEAWLKLAGSPRVAAASRLHFKRIAARAMRQILVEAARRRHAGKRSGGRITFDDSLEAAEERDLLGLDAALNDLAAIEPRQAMMVESLLRWFGSGRGRHFAGRFRSDDSERLARRKGVARAGASPPMIDRAQWSRIFQR